MDRILDQTTTMRYPNSWRCCMKKIILIIASITIGISTAYAQTGSSSSSYLYYDHAKNNPYFSGSFDILMNPAYTDNPKLYRIWSSAEAKRMTSYYKDLERWRSSERERLRKQGAYDREAIERLYR